MDNDIDLRTHKMPTPGRNDSVLTILGALPPAAPPSSSDVPTWLSTLGIAIIMTFACLLTLIAVSALWISFKRLGMKRVHNEPPEALQGGVMRFSFSEIIEGTKRFHHGQLIEKGTESSYYRFCRPGLPDLMARRLHLPLPPHRRSEDFQVAVTRLAQITSHRSLVKLVGFSVKGYERVLVYEMLSSGPLRRFIYQSDAKLTWQQRLHILLSVARGLHHLHHLTPPCPHGTLESSRILLSAKLEAKIHGAGELLWLSDVGLQPPSVHGSQRAGFAAPEQVVSGNAGPIPLSPSGDIYSFGVLLLEVFTGRMALDMSRGPQESVLADFMRPILSQEDDALAYLDPLLQGDVTLGSVLLVAELAAQCIAVDPALRPSISSCVSLLVRALYDPESHGQRLKRNNSNTSHVVDSFQSQ